MIEKMNRPEFRYATFTLYFKFQYFDVLFLPTDEKSIYRIIIRSDTEKLSEAITSDLATKTSAIYHLSKHLGLNTNNIR